jgi:tetratricopeptide (TPR) repeat protein
MGIHRIVHATAAWLAAAAAALAVDQVKTTRAPLLLGRVVSITAQQIDLEQSSGGALAKQIPVNEIVFILFEDEPRQLAQARKHVMDGQYEEAQTALDKIDATGAKNKNIAIEIEYTKALCAARLALAGSGSVVEAGKQMYAFIRTNPTSYHYLEACELEGDLLAANRAYDKAETFYGHLAQAPWPDYKMRAKAALGRALLAQNKIAEASKAFDEVVSSDASGPLAEQQRMLAQLGKARCLAASQKADQAIKMVESIITKIDADNIEMHARAYNALGMALRRAYKPKEALLAFLHVDLLYNTMPDAHAEALANMVELFTELHKADHARRARATLEEHYKGSPWAAGLK